MQLIESISRKISILDGEKDSIDNEIEANETLRRCIVNDLLNNCENQVLVEKIEKNLAQNSQLIRFVLNSVLIKILIGAIFLFLIDF